MPYNHNGKRSGMFDCNKMFLAGGAIGSLLRNEPPNDYDLYFKDETDAKSFMQLINSCEEEGTSVVAEYSDEYGDAQSNQPQEPHLPLFKDDLLAVDVTGPKQKLITENAVTMENKLQFISNSRLVGEPEAVVAGFDYLHCTAFLDFATDRFYLPEQVFRAIINKELIINNGPRVTQQRLDKFLTRGYTQTTTRKYHLYNYHNQ